MPAFGTAPNEQHPQHISAAGANVRIGANSLLEPVPSATLRVRRPASIGAFCPARAPGSKNHAVERHDEDK